jgi:hypothetical protein
MEEQIRHIEEQLQQTLGKKLSKTSDAYEGTLELFSMKHLNRRKDPDLIPCTRRPPKGK